MNKYFIQFAYKQVRRKLMRRLRHAACDVSHDQIWYKSHISPIWKIKHDIFGNKTTFRTLTAQILILQPRGQLFGYLNSNQMLRWNGDLSLTSCHSDSSEPNVFKLLELDKVKSSYNLYVLDFFTLVTWGQVNFVTCPCHEIGELSTTSFSHWNISIHSGWCYLRSSVMIQVSVFIGDPQKVICGHQSLLPITFELKEIETWESGVVSLFLSDQDTLIHM